MRRFLAKILLTVAAVTALALPTLALPTVALAAEPACDTSGNINECATAPQPSNITCPEGQVAIGVPITKNPGGGSNCVDNSGGGIVVNYLKTILQFLSATVGAAVVLMVIVAGIQYIVSNGDPKAITDAKDRLINAVTALVLFILAFAILSFVVPGGIL